MKAGSLNPIGAVTWDAGQTLVELDTGFLVERLRERGAAVDLSEVDAALPDAWDVYDRVVGQGLFKNSWKAFMEALLSRAGLRRAALHDTVTWLYEEQSRHNLWRRPIPGMVELADELREARIPIGIVSNSEGGLADLLETMGWGDRFPVVADSGRLGLEKPDPAIFHWALKKMGVEPSQAVHVGDSRAADVEGALAAGLRAIWFTRNLEPALGEGVTACRNAVEVRATFVEWGLLRC